MRQTETLVCLFVLFLLYLRVLMLKDIVILMNRMIVMKGFLFLFCIVEENVAKDVYVTR